MIRMRTNETQFAYRPNFRANLYIFSYRLAVNFILNWNFITLEMINLFELYKEGTFKAFEFVILIS